MMENKLRVPTLRFPEFASSGSAEGAGDWVEKRIGELCQTFKSGSSITASHIHDEGNYPVYGGNGLRGYTNTFTHDGVYFLIGRQGALCGNINRTIGKTFISEHAIAVDANNSSDTEFLAQRLDYFNLNKLSESSAQPGLAVNKLLRFKLLVPPLPEQQKIASFLSAVDAKISQLTQKGVLLGEYKRGVMQGIFSQEIRFRADDGSAFGDWVERLIIECIDNIGGTPLEKYVSKGATYKFISIGNYSTSGKYIDNGQRIELNDKTKTKLLNKNDLVMVLNDKTKTGDIIGSTIHIEEDDRYIYNQRSERIICKSVVKPKFLWHYFNSKIFRKKVFSLSQGGTQIYINFSSIKSINIALPSLPEQTKIANFLSSIDKKIEQNTQSLEKMKTFKRGLLQGMFV